MNGLYIYVFTFVVFITSVSHFYPTFYSICTYIHMYMYIWLICARVKAGLYTHNYWRIPEDGYTHCKDSHGTGWMTIPDSSHASGIYVFPLYPVNIIANFIFDIYIYYVWPFISNLCALFISQVFTIINHYTMITIRAARLEDLLGVSQSSKLLGLSWEVLATAQCGSQMLGSVQKLWNKSM